MIMYLYFLFLSNNYFLRSIKIFKNIFFNFLIIKKLIFINILLDNYIIGISSPKKGKYKH